MPMDSHVHFAPVLTLDFKPVGKLSRCPSRLPFQTGQHVPPCRNDQLRPAFQSARRCFNPAAQHRCPALAASHPAFGANAPPSAAMAPKTRQCAIEVSRGIAQFRPNRPDLGFHAVRRCAARACAPAHGDKFARGILRPPPAACRSAPATAILRQRVLRSRSVPAANHPPPVRRQISSRSRSSRPRLRERLPSGPRIQWRNSAISAPESTAAKAESELSNRWWPSSNTKCVGPAARSHLHRCPRTDIARGMRQHERMIGDNNV